MTPLPNEHARHIPARQWRSYKVGLTVAVSARETRVTKDYLSNRELWENDTRVRFGAHDLLDLQTVMLPRKDADPVSCIPVQRHPAVLGAVATTVMFLNAQGIPFKHHETSMESNIYVRTHFHADPGMVERLPPDLPLLDSQQWVLDLIDLLRGQVPELH